MNISARYFFDSLFSLGFYGGETALTEKADSYVCGVADAPLLGETIGRSLDLAARRSCRTYGFWKNSLAF